MTTALKNTDIARLLADTSNADEIGSIARQVQHWTVSNLFDFTDVKIADPSVGRGKAREYPEAALPWAALMLEMARRSLSIAEMAQAIQGLQFNRAVAKKDGGADPFAEALAGSPKPIFLVITTLRLTGGHVPRVPLVRTEVVTGSYKIGAEWISGTIINLTAVLARARS